MYLLDANVFIQAKNLHFGFDFCPAFWSWLDLAHEDQKVFSIEKVEQELTAGTDELASWAKERPVSFFLRPEPSTIPSLQATSRWAVQSGHDQSAINTFLQVADYYLVAHAHSLGYTVVTHEIAGSSRKRIKIPDACIGLRIKVMSPFAMLRTERARFVLE